MMRNGCTGSFCANSGPAPRMARTKAVIRTGRFYNPRRMTLITSAGDLAALEPQWLALCRRTAGTTPFQTPMWLLPWWRHFGSDQLAVIATPEAIAPLYIVRDGDESLGMFLGTGNSDYLDVVGDAASVMDELAGLDCQMWDLQQLRPASSVLSAPLPAGWSDSVSDHDVCPILPLAEVDALTSTHFRKKLRYYRRALERLGAVRVEGATRSEERRVGKECRYRGSA